MLVLCYGITKSGSTLAFELVKGVLKSAGHRQPRLPDDVVSTGHKVNFVEKVDKAVINRLLDGIPEDKMIAVKTHTSLTPPTFRHIEALQDSRKLQVIASYRDPRDICLSLVDAGKKAKANAQRAFSEFSDIASTQAAVERQLKTFRKWASIRGALRLNYDTVAFQPEKAIERIESVLGIEGDHAEAKRYAFQDAFTQRNKAVRRRYEQELDEEQNKALTQAFDQFIRRVCKHDDDLWFSAFREKFLAGAGAGKD